MLALKAEANLGYIVTVLRGLKTLYEGPTSAIKAFTLKISGKNFNYVYSV